MSKDRLEEIISNEAYLEDTNDLVMVINTEDYKWLIGQAERLQELRKRYLILTKENNQVNDELIDEFRKNKRYREYLELIKTTGTYGKDISTGEILRTYEANLADEALEGKSE